MSADVNGERGVGRRALLTRGGVVAAGVAGVAAAGAALAGPASAATGDAVLQGESNNVGTNAAATEITVANAPTTPTPTLVLTNTGGDTSTNEASPSLRLTPAGANLLFPADNTVGGDVVATNDGNLWFTHNFGGTTGIFPATVHTDATDNLFVPLASPIRIFDTRQASTRTNIIDASGNLNSAGQLIGGHTIHIDISDGGQLVFFATATVANLTVTKPAGSGFLTLWSGAGAKPTASAINFSTNQTIANLNVTANGEFISGNTAVTDSIAVFASVTTHVLLDITGFIVPNGGQVNPAFLATGATKAGVSRSRAAKARAATHAPSWVKG